METAIECTEEISVQEYLDNGTFADYADCITEHAIYVAKHDVFNSVYVEFDDGSCYFFDGIKCDMIIDICKHEKIPY